MVLKELNVKMFQERIKYVYVEFKFKPGDTIYFMKYGQISPNEYKVEACIVEYMGEIFYKTKSSICVDNPQYIPDSLAGATPKEAVQKYGVIELDKLNNYKKDLEKVLERANAS